MAEKKKWDNWLEALQAMSAQQPPTEAPGQMSAPPPAVQVIPPQPMNAMQLNRRTADTAADIVDDKTSESAQLQRQLKRYLGLQQENVNQQNKLADAAAEQPQQTDISPLLALADSWGAGGVSKGYTKPPTKMERLAMIAGLKEKANAGQQNITKDVLTQMLGADKTNAALLRFIAGGADKDKKTDAAMSKEINKMMQDAGKDLDIYKARSGAVGQIGKTQVTAGRLATMVNAFKDNNLPPQQMAELAAGLAGLATGGNVVAQEQIRNILPATAASSAANLQQWFTNEPQGAGQQEFVKMMMHTINREAQTAGKQARSLRLRYLPKHAALYRQAPDEFKQLAAANGISPQELDDAFQADPEAVAKAFEELPIAGGGDERPSQVEESDWAKATPEEKAALSNHFKGK